MGTWNLLKNSKRNKQASLRVRRMCGMDFQASSASSAAMLPLDGCIITKLQASKLCRENITTPKLPVLSPSKFIRDSALLTTWTPHVSALRKNSCLASNVTKYVLEC